MGLLPRPIIFELSLCLGGQRHTVAYLCVILSVAEISRRSLKTKHSIISSSLLGNLYNLE